MSGAYHTCTNISISMGALETMPSRGMLSIMIEAMRLQSSLWMTLTQFPLACPASVRVPSIVEQFSSDLSCRLQLLLYSRDNSVNGVELLSPDLMGLKSHIEALFQM